MAFHIKSLKNVKKGAMHPVGWVVVGLLAVGGVVDYSDDQKINLSFMGESPDTSVGPLDSVSTISSNLVIEDINFTNSNYTVTKIAQSSGIDTFEIEVDKDDIAADALEAFTVTMFNDIPEGTNVAEYITPKTVLVGLSSDLKASNADGISKVIVSKEDSTVEGVKTSKKVTFTGVTAQTLDFVYNTNPYSETLSEMRDFDDVGEKKEYTLNFGAQNVVKLIITN